MGRVGNVLRFKVLAVWFREEPLFGADDRVLVTNSRVL
jgi:hypothetical protein